MSVVWLTGVSVVLYFIKKQQKLLLNIDGGGTLETILGKVLDSQALTRKEISQITEKVNKISEQMMLGIKKVGVVKFNPFSETGGVQSFSLALLNSHDDGFVLTSLHSRSGTRSYLKPVQNGVSDLELSAEEKKALREAIFKK